MKESFTKGIVHAALTAAAVAEYLHCTSRTRKFLIGLAAGWHAHATFYHFILEKDVDKQENKQ